MRVFHRIEEIPDTLAKTAVAIGNFDGVHLGHVTLLNRMLAHAKNKHLLASVLTFFPHPVEILRPGTHIERLTTTSEKLGIFETMGIEVVLVQPFDKALSELSPIEFLNRYLGVGLKAETIHVGANFMFGKNRMGNTEILRKWANEKKLLLDLVPPVSLFDEKVSSSLIRKLISEGKVKQASELLGHPYSVLGQVTEGDHRGSQLGFPTANLKISGNKIIPQNGVYLTRTTWQKQSFPSVTNIGVRPTFGLTGEQTRIEVHILDFTQRLYDEPIQLEFLDRLRDERKFDSAQSLSDQIQKDVESARGSPWFR